MSVQPHRRCVHDRARCHEACTLARFLGPLSNRRRVVRRVDHGLPVLVGDVRGDADGLDVSLDSRQVGGRGTRRVGHLGVDAVSLKSSK